jgi:hypothetical protein
MTVRRGLSVTCCIRRYLGLHNSGSQLAVQTPDEVETLPQDIDHFGTTRADVRDTVGCVRVGATGTCQPRVLTAPSPCPGDRPPPMPRQPTTTSAGERMSPYPSHDRLNENRSLAE